MQVAVQILYVSYIEAKCEQIYSNTFHLSLVNHFKSYTVK